MKKTLFTIIILLGFSFNIHSQVYVSKAKAIEDIDFFFDNAEQIHPNLYFKISKSDLSKHIYSLKNNINDSISINEFSRKMRVLVNYIGDGHTNVVFSKELVDKYHNERSRLPFKIKINSDKFIVKETQTAKLLEGDEILSINKIKPKIF